MLNGHSSPPATTAWRPLLARCPLPPHCLVWPEQFLYLTISHVEFLFLMLKFFPKILFFCSSKEYRPAISSAMLLWQRREKVRSIKQLQIIFFFPVTSVFLWLFFLTISHKQEDWLCFRYDNNHIIVITWKKERQFELTMWRHLKSISVMVLQSMELIADEGRLKSGEFVRIRRLMSSWWKCCLAVICFAAFRHRQCWVLACARGGRRKQTHQQGGSHTV